MFILFCTGIVGPPGPPGPPGEGCKIVKSLSGQLTCDKNYVMVRCWGSCGVQQIVGTSTCISKCNSYGGAKGALNYAICCKVDISVY